ncbi:MAG: FAD-binding dehydrogenase [Mesorhizobium sp.]
MTERFDAIVIGGGLAGLVAAAELGDAGRRTLILEQEGGDWLGGQAHWSLGGLFLIDTPEQRRLGIRDSRDLAWQDWQGSAQFDRPQDFWPRKVAEAYVDFAAGEMRPWLHAMGMRWWPVVGWAERGGALANGHGNSVPRFHLTWGTGPGVVAPFERRVREHVVRGLTTLKFRHRVSRLVRTGRAVTGVAGEILEATNVERGQQSGREVIGDFEFAADHVLVMSGGIGGDHDYVRKVWPTDRLGPAPKSMVAGVPHHVDGRMIEIGRKAGADVINVDRMWHYVEGIRNWDPIWPNHGIRILSAPSPMWFDANGKRLEAPFFPSYDSLGTLKRVLSTGKDYSWFVMTAKMAAKELVLSGSEQNLDFTGKDWRAVMKNRRGGKAPPSVKAFLDKGEDFILRDNLEDLVTAMNALTGDGLIEVDALRGQIEARDREVAHSYSKDAQIQGINNARRYLGDKIFRVTKPHRILDPANGPLIAVRLHILTRKTLGGLHTNLDGQVLDQAGEPIPGLYAAGEVAGGGGGGYHGYNALEGTFLGSCLFSGRQAGRKAAG